MLADCHISSGANVGSRWVVSWRPPFTDVSPSAPFPGCGVVAYGDVSLPPSVVAFKGVCAPSRFPSSESTASSSPSRPPLPAGPLPWWGPYFQPQSTMLFSFAKKQFRLIGVCFFVLPLLTQQEEIGCINITLRKCFPLMSRPISPYFHIYFSITLSGLFLLSPLFLSMSLCFADWGWLCRVE